MRKRAVKRVLDSGAVVWSDPREPAYEDFVSPECCVPYDQEFTALIRDAVILNAWIFARKHSDKKKPVKKKDGNFFGKSG